MMPVKRRLGVAVASALSVAATITVIAVEMPSRDSQRRVPVTTVSQAAPVHGNVPLPPEIRRIVRDIARELKVWHAWPNSIVLRVPWSGAEANGTRNRSTRSTS